ncbi:MAG: L-rhamnose mutarotase [Thermoplasmata archaeon]|nr:L-rhamnose mutarotase [Candidatus Sysuiplasma jiujiangense]
MRYAFHLKIRKNMETEYVARHRNVWPSMIDELKRSGIRNYSIYIDGLDVFGYWECNDINETLKFLRDSRINADWQNHMSEVLETPSDDRISEGLREIYRLD